MLLIENEFDIPLHVKLLEQICTEHTPKEVELLIIDSASMQTLNLEHRGMDKTTDVLSFPIDDFPHAPLGSIVINHELAAQKAKELGHSVEEEITLLFIHGMLHLLGFDHEVDSGQMREMETSWITQYHLPKSLIVRTED
ncbi:MULTISPECIES: rRNA maturation RNase YbeY [unclassified Sulfurospirillum]|uniref:rRNA maturation RNase YbeY n=1 Tax=unclassified Sulfurospirillum TaxID=2618290 RepID=UPI0005036FA7|nr:MULTISPECIES: rRNA maturation RNase YbeY [unclassified Sulfurospirillum]KFL34881.1 heat-shock protein [Sulfurospirillum sp. SCADC]